jgi:centromere protein C
VSYHGNVIHRRLPIPPTRPKTDSKVGAFAGSAFNIPYENSTDFVGYLMGSLTIPPKGIKDPESVGACTQAFTVVSGQNGSLEVAYADPNTERGVLLPASAQRFLLSPKDMFRVPPGNCYRLQNHSRTMECILTWVIIKPSIPPEEE